VQLGRTLERKILEFRSLVKKIANPKLRTNKKRRLLLGKRGLLFLRTVLPSVIAALNGGQYEPIQLQETDAIEAGDVQSPLPRPQADAELPE